MGSVSDDDRPALRVGDYVIDREDEAESDEEPSIMLVVELTLKRADAVYIDDGTTVADVNADQYATDDVVRVVYPVAGQTHIDNHDLYSFPRGRLKRTATIHREKLETRICWIPWPLIGVRGLSIHANLLLRSYITHR